MNFYLFIFAFPENNLNTIMNEKLNGSPIPILYSNVSKHILKITICYEIQFLIFFKKLIIIKGELYNGILLILSLS